MNREIKSAKSRYYCDLISETKGDLNKLWEAVNADGAHHTNPWSIHSALNSHFVSIGRILPEKISCIARASLPVNDHSRLFQSQEISESVAHKQLPALKANKAIGLDNVHARLLKCSAQSITYSITKLINLSLRTGKFQGMWKCLSDSFIKIWRPNKSNKLSPYFNFTHSQQDLRKGNPLSVVRIP